MSALVIHGLPISTYVRTARMACVEKGVDYQLDPRRPGETRELGLHPFGKIPAMTNGQIKLFETSSIVRYIDEVFDGPPLQPADARARAVMNQWISAIKDVVFDAMVRRWYIRFYFLMGPEGTPDRSVIDPAIEQAREQVAALDAALAEGPFLAGGRLSLADLFLAPVVALLRGLPEGPAMLETAPNLARALAAMEARPSFAATLPPQA